MVSTREVETQRDYQKLVRHLGLLIADINNVVVRAQKAIEDYLVEEERLKENYANRKPNTELNQTPASKSQSAHDDVF